MSAENNTLKRSLTLFPCIMIMISSVVGSGIFSVSGEIMAVAQGSGTNFLAWIIAGLCVLLMCNIYMELAPAMPVAGGGYVYLTKAYGKNLAFFYGWGRLVNDVSVIALYAMACMNYLTYFIPMNDITKKLVGSVLIVVIVILNIRGVKQSSSTNNILTVAKLLGIGVIIVGGLCLMSKANFQPVASPEKGWSTVGAAAVPAFFAFGGFNQICYMSEEIKNPGKTLPKAIIIGITSILAIYLLLTTASIGTLGVEKLGASDKAMVSVANVVFGDFAAVLIAILGIVSIVASMNAIVLATPRIAFSMGRDGSYPYVMGKVHPKYDTPYVAILVYGVFALALLWLGSFGTLLSVCVFVGRIMDCLVACSVLTLRKKFPDMVRPFKMKGYPITLFLCIALSLYLAFNVTTQRMLFSAILVLIGVPVFFITKAVNKNHPES